MIHYSTFCNSSCGWLLMEATESRPRIWQASCWRTVWTWCPLPSKWDSIKVEITWEDYSGIENQLTMLTMIFGIVHRWIYSRLAIAHPLGGKEDCQSVHSFFSSPITWGMGFQKDFFVFSFVVTISSFAVTTGIDIDRENIHTSTAGNDRSGQKMLQLNVYWSLGTKCTTFWSRLGTSFKMADFSFGLWELQFPSIVGLWLQSRFEWTYKIDHVQSSHLFFYIFLRLMMLTQTNISQHSLKGKIAGNRDEKPPTILSIARNAGWGDLQVLRPRCARRGAGCAGSDELITEANNLW